MKGINPVTEEVLKTNLLNEEENEKLKEVDDIINLFSDFLMGGEEDDR